MHSLAEDRYLRTRVGQPSGENLRGKRHRFRFSILLFYIYFFFFERKNLVVDSLIHCPVVGPFSSAIIDEIAGIGKKESVNQAVVIDRSAHVAWPRNRCHVRDEISRVEASGRR
ncbi:uncharacterized protein LOC143154084 [Ptiloglossa arizonensis]|uniref:uncharacterized protein LOC143154084 n=1 Tax=Ptiloglossa arizonensis TaxID=3350558 RepID=UPI003F9EEB46